MGPRVSRRIGTSSEALWRGASGGSKNRYLVRGLARGASGESENRYLVRGLARGASGESENRYLVRGLVVSFWAEPALGEPGYYLRWAGWSSQASDKVGVCQWLSLGFDIYKV